MVTGLDLTGVVPGRLHGRFASVEDDWYGIVNYEIGYADGRRDKLHLVDQFAVHPRCANAGSSRARRTRHVKFRLRARTVCVPRSHWKRAAGLPRFGI